MQIYYLRCPKCKTLLGTVCEGETPNEPKCYWTILADGARGIKPGDTQWILCKSCGEILSVYKTWKKPFILRRRRKK